MANVDAEWLTKRIVMKSRQDDRCLRDSFEHMRQAAKAMLELSQTPGIDDKPMDPELRQAVETVHKFTRIMREFQE
jgi:hypothetical protein